MSTSQTLDPDGYYSILRVSPSADAATIKAAFRKRAMELHPDRNPAPSATAEFQKLNDAYNTLSSPQARATYDASGIDASISRASSSVKADPLACMCCGKVTAQPRYVIFYQVISFVFGAYRRPIQGIYCSQCAGKQALIASAVTWLLGWWSLHGFFWSLHAVFQNMVGGQQDHSVNARLAAYQAAAFWAHGKRELASAIALDAIWHAKKMKPSLSERQLKGVLGDEFFTESDELIAQMRQFVPAQGTTVRIHLLKNTWALLQWPFFTQVIALLVIILLIATAVLADRRPRNSNRAPYNPNPMVQPVASSESQPEQDPNKINRYLEGQESAPTIQPSSRVAPPAATRSTNTYNRPDTAPNGQPWPVEANYIDGYRVLNFDGYCTVTIDNTQNDSDVFIKLVSRDGIEEFPARIFYIPGRSSFKLESVSPGSYDIRYRDLNTGALARSDAFELEQIEVYQGIQYSEFTMTLYKVAHGNMRTHSLSESEF